MLFIYILFTLAISTIINASVDPEKYHCAYTTLTAKDGEAELQLILDDVVYCHKKQSTKYWEFNIICDKQANTSLFAKFKYQSDRSWDVDFMIGDKQQFNVRMKQSKNCDECLKYNKFYQEYIGDGCSHKLVEQVHATAMATSIKDIKNINNISNLILMVCCLWIVFLVI